MMRVEKRSVALTGTMSFWAYFTTRAESEAACAGSWLRAKMPRAATATNVRKQRLVEIDVPFIPLLLVRDLDLLQAVVSVGEETDNPRQGECGESRYENHHEGEP